MKNKLCMRKDQPGKVKTQFKGMTDKVAKLKKRKLKESFIIIKSEIT